MKKVLSVILALLMVLGCFSLFASATQSKAALEISVVPTQTTYNKGDIVTFEVFYETSDELFNMGAAYFMQFGFDSSVFETIEDLSSDTGWNSSSTFIYEGYPIANNVKLAFCHAQAWCGIANLNDTYGSLTDIDKAKGWDSVLGCIQTPDNSCDDSYAEKTASFAFKLKVKDDASDTGCYTVGVTDWAINNGKCEVDEENGSIAGASGTEYGFATEKMFATNDATVNVATAAASIIKDGGAQIRFRGIGQNGAAADYKGEFDVRTVATISQADFVANFGTDDNAIEKITDIGFVYATATNVPAFDADTAKGVAEGTAATGYVKAPVNYIQHAADGEDYRFTCLIRNIADADKNETVNALAYVCYDGTYFYFDAPVAVSYAALYERMPK